jgi:hypothetical protein
MIRLTESQYAAIGKVAVQSGTLERELGEYLVRLAVPKFKDNLPISNRAKLLCGFLAGGAVAPTAFQDFDFVLTRIGALIEERNTLAHGTWSEVANAPTTLGEVSVIGKTATIHARDIEAVASKLRTARKLLLRLFHDCLPVAAGHKKCPRRSAAELKRQL